MPYYLRKCLNLYVSQTRKLSRYLFLTVNVSSQGLISIHNSIVSLHYQSRQGAQWQVPLLFEKKEYQNDHSLSLALIRCHSLSFVITRCHSLSLVVIPYHSLSFLSLVVSRCTTCCRSLLFVVTRCTTRCHSLSLVVPLVVIRCTRCDSMYHSSVFL